MIPTEKIPVACFPVRILRYCCANPLKVIYATVLFLLMLVIGMGIFLHGHWINIGLEGDNGSLAGSMTPSK